MNIDWMKFRRASFEDLTAIVKLISDDKLGVLRENYCMPLPVEYETAFKRIDGDENQELIVVTDKQEEIIGVFQLSFIQYLTYQGGIRAQIEGVRVRDDYRGEGVGEEMIRWAIQRAKQRNAHLLQLTTDKKRPRALQFYEKMGFVASHEGLKLHLKE